jgi:hypothetical protein
MVKTRGSTNLLLLGAVVFVGATISALLPVLA